MEWCLRNHPQEPNSTRLLESNFILQIECLTVDVQQPRPAIVTTVQPKDLSCVPDSHPGVQGFLAGTFLEGLGLVVGWIAHWDWHC